MRNRRGLSSVVGMVFAIIAIVTSISYVTYSLTTLDQYNQSTLARNQQSIDAGKESFQLYSTKFSPQTGGYKFNLTIANTGSLPINITRMWVQNTTATDWTNVYSINKMVGPGSLLTNIGQSSPIYANPSYSYNIKLATSRGNALQFSIGSANSVPLFVQLDLFPTSLRSGYNATLMYIVTNNATSNNALVNLIPTASCLQYGGLPNNGVTLGTLYGPTPSQYPSLPPGNTAIFKWTVKISNSSNVPNSANNAFSVKCTAQLNTLNTASDILWMTSTTHS
jgi:hypothetical protein